MVSAKIPSSTVKVERIILKSNSEDKLVRLFLVDQQNKREITLSDSTLGIGLSILADLPHEEHILEIPKVKSLAIFNKNKIFVTGADDFTYEFFLDPEHAEMEYRKSHGSNGPMLDYLANMKAAVY
jgi:hypothetical protein